ncbi:hypothetical protein NGB36_28285 [Streptomyces sp. RB6PN25]|uniref:Resolvase/invertase-type recombinase catalytic domain-containing protein n=1 Tax=Streptomyces humicola TaxID=2953240 RepID=A0ABT1Q375_9ACTN|nr:hypothetical protein [Streptomyces humicola]MCQ4084374.1 hypothetical protein [Streptomyces humicola]
MLSDSRPATGRVPVALYIATDVSDDEASHLMRCCRDYAEARHWTVAAAVCDTGTTAPLTGRPGWCEITAALGTGSARGVVTWQRRMIAADTTAYETLTALVADRGGFLAIASDSRTPIEMRPGIPLPRRTPGQVQRLRWIADAAAGFGPWMPEAIS